MVGGFEYSDGQMDEMGLGLWVARLASQNGCDIREGAEVCRLSWEGRVMLANGEEVEFDWVVNVAGPWAEVLARRSGMALRHSLDLVRGSHLILDRPCETTGWLLESPVDRRLFFILPWKGRTLLGTTEVRQNLDEPIRCSEEERTYLIEAYNHYFSPDIGAGDVVDEFSGLRPLIRSSDSPTRASREYVIERHGNVLTVLGGKWTTARALGEKVAKRVTNGIH